jgi:hypothetical protein
MSKQTGPMQNAIDAIRYVKKRYGVDSEVCEQPPLLQIQLDDYGEPTIFYKGEEITNKVQIEFKWRTADDKDQSRINILIKHYEDTDRAIVLNTIKQNISK